MQEKENENEIVITIKNLNKSYKMFRHKRDRLIESLVPK